MLSAGGGERPAWCRQLLITLASLDLERPLHAHSPAPSRQRAEAQAPLPLAGARLVRRGLALARDDKRVAVGALARLRLHKAVLKILLVQVAAPLFKAARAVLDAVRGPASSAGSRGRRET